MVEWTRVHPAAGHLAVMAARSGPDAVLEPAPFLAQVSLRVGAAGRAAAEQALGSLLPPTNRVASCRDGELLGLGPDEWLHLGADGTAPNTVGWLVATVGGDGAVVDVSDARGGLILRGACARDVLASCIALDFHPSVFAPGHCAATLLGKVPVLIQQLDQVPSYRLLVRPSLLAYVVDWLVDGLPCR